jgi:hypothetical protein
MRYVHAPSIRTRRASALPALVMPPYGLHSLDHGPHRPIGKQILDLRGQALDPCLGILDGVDVILQHNLLGGMIEPDTGEPSPVGAVPALLARIDAAMAQQKPLQILARLAEHAHCRRPRTDEITHCLVRIVRHPHARQLAGPVQLG